MLTPLLGHLPRPQDGLLVGDPRRSAWRDFLKPIVGNANLQPDVGHLPEVSRAVVQAYSGPPVLHMIASLASRPAIHPTVLFALFLQLLNTAFAAHEIISDNAEAWFKWLDARGKKRVAEFLPG